MSDSYAVAICANLDMEGEKEKFSEEEILQAIKNILTMNHKYVCKPAMLNSIAYLLEKVQAS